jgi:predicted MFS family arabinose efflux permease
VPFVNLYFKDSLGAGPAQVATYMSIARFAMVIGFIAAPLVARRFGMLRSVVVTELISIPFLIVMAMWDYFGFYMIIAAYVARQSLMNMTQPLAANFALEVVPPREQAITNSMRMLAGNAGRAVFALIGGIIIDRYGFKPAILGMAVFYLAAAVSYILFFRKHKFYQSQISEEPVHEHTQEEENQGSCEGKCEIEDESA